MPSLFKTSASGIVWLIVQSGAARLIGFLAQLILARLLMPSDFGVIALAQSVAAIITVLTGFGLDDVIMSRSRLLRLWLAPAFWASLSFSLLGAALLFVGSPIAVHLYRSPALTGLLGILAVSMPLTALCVVPDACLRANLKFRFVAVYGTAEFIGIQAATVLFAWFGFGPYSFVLPVPMAAIVKAAVFWTAARPPVVWKFRRQQTRLILLSGSAVFGQKLLTAMRNNADYALLGIVATKSSVGLYFLAFKLAAMPVYTLANGITGALFPAFAQLRGDPKRQLTAALCASRIIAFAVLPFSFLQAALSGPVIHIFFGVKWQGASSLVSILSVGLAFDLVPCVLGSMMSANGKFRLQWLFSLFSFPVFAMLIVIGWFAHGTTGVAAGVAAFFVIVAPIYSYFAARSFGARVSDILKIYVPPTLCAGVAVGSARMIASLPGVRDHELEVLIVTSVLGGILYILLSLLFSRAPMSDTVDRFTLLLARTS
jgi:O-antigen/teichoic acid export membrane protein